MGGRLYIVGCEPRETEEGIGLSEPVGLGVKEAIPLIHKLIENLSEGNASAELDVKIPNR
jgi:hypothetical protein